MTAFLCRVALLLSGLWLLPMLLIRAQRYDDGGLRTFLTPPEDCLAPCFMDIRPGVTTVSEAVVILDTHPWVLWEDESPNFRPGDTGISWIWSEAVPSWISPDGFGRVGLSYVNDTDYGTELDLIATISLAEFRLAFGAPDKYVMSSDRGPGGTSTFYRYWGWYDDIGMAVEAQGLCPGATLSLYDWPVLLHVWALPPDFGVGPRPPMTNCR